MSDDNVTPFPVRPSRKKVKACEIDVIEFQTNDGRDLYIDDRADIEKIMNFLKQKGIKIVIAPP